MPTHCRTLLRALRALRAHYRAYCQSLLLTGLHTAAHRRAHCRTQVAVRTAAHCCTLAHCRTATESRCKFTSIHTRSHKITYGIRYTAYCIRHTAYDLRLTAPPLLLRIADSWYNFATSVLPCAAIADLGKCIVMYVAQQPPSCATLRLADW
jgi:hypothetical protein